MPNAMECDEHLCPYLAVTHVVMEQCVDWVTRMAFQTFVPAEDDCFNKRNLNYMCETKSTSTCLDTSESGLCWPDKDYDDLRYPSMEYD